MQLILGVILISIGIYLSQYNIRPFIDFNFHLAWFGFLLVSDNIAFRFSGKSIFSNWRNFLSLAFASAFFWWFYEWANIFLKNWFYPTKHLYEQTEWGILSTAAFVTVLPHLAISTNIISGVLKSNIFFVKAKISSQLTILLMSLGLISLALVIYLPIYLFPLIWIVTFLILDPLNAIQGRRSLILQILKKNYKPLIVLGIGAIFAGFWWETINFLIPKWTYPIVPWFWELPAPITTKYAQMPLAGFLGYIPFIYSAFAFVEFLQIKIPWLNSKNK
ncbi:MAG: hypothetical protein A2798_02970 [Candidatus Levybacteria bacterium RIFCSPHIGHO2_01_FULL_37_17]|nr:MAG: hypothetical protein A2798_02970 [Candidatus Levybacteria bacterium RIFCSPHIGHO2_01_FULL_37_17]OGH36817.1 MAG: hypothetical protein A2959_00960 [Candidatus Levybacteria bacterium RIFCSPLOWO2_01_FULL_38_23]